MGKGVAHLQGFQGVWILAFSTTAPAPNKRSFAAYAGNGVHRWLSIGSSCHEDSPDKGTFCLASGLVSTSSAGHLL